MSIPSANRLIRGASVVIRRATPEDVPVCANICYVAFSEISAAHHFPPDLPGPDAATGLLSMMFSHPGFYCVVAELDGRIVGSNCLDERSAVGGIGPITVDPNAQNRSLGRRLMEAVIERARERGSPAIRLVQAAFHNRSLSLYAKLGFSVREPLAVMQRTTRRAQPDGSRTRPVHEVDLERCNQLCRVTHGHDRGGELADAIRQGTATCVERDGRITGYATALAFFGHAVAESNADLQALIASVESFGGPGILLPTRNTALFRWCLESGLRVVQPMTLMSVGLYNEPAGAYLPSISF
jgi:GNAT superfamily N-acetyltransferase